MKHQTIKPAREELVLLPRSEYDALVARAAKRATADEDAADLHALERSQAAVAAGRDVLLPSKVAEAIMNGGNPLRAIREWRDLTQAELAEKAKLPQSLMSALETGNRNGTTKQWKALAQVLRVPMDVLIED